MKIASNNMVMVFRVIRVTVCLCFRRGLKTENFSSRFNLIYTFFVLKWVRGAGNLTTLKFTSKGRAPCACGAGGLRRRNHGGVLARIPLIWVDPRTAVRAWCMSGAPNCRNLPWTGNTVACRSKALNGKPP